MKAGESFQSAQHEHRQILDNHCDPRSESVWVFPFLQTNNFDTRIHLYIAIEHNRFPHVDLRAAGASNLDRSRRKIFDVPARLTPLSKHRILARRRFPEQKAADHIARRIATNDLRDDAMSTRSRSAIKSDRRTICDTHHVCCGECSKIVVIPDDDGNQCLTANTAFAGCPLMACILNVDRYLVSVLAGAS